MISRVGEHEHFEVWHTYACTRLIIEVEFAVLETRRMF